jgi:hypothetical protein
MTKTFVGAKAAVVASATLPAAAFPMATNTESRMPNLGRRARTLQRVKDDVIYWALRIYMRILRAIADVSELIANHPRKEDR